jgi:endonuclease/exonuclease/phosphatase family metal-dependent hydrolase
LAIRRTGTGNGPRPRRRRRTKAERQTRHLTEPHLCLLQAPSEARPTPSLGQQLRIATYNVHRWTAPRKRSHDASLASHVIAELDADVIALQEVMRPHDGDDPLASLADQLGLHLAFAATRFHKRGELGNAILSRWPISGVAMLDLSYSRLERRVAVAAQFQSEDRVVDVVATHLALGDRTRHRQVRYLLDHPQVQRGPTILLGDMNAWRDCKAIRALDDELHSHDNRAWPASFPASRPVLALDRIYTRGARILEIAAHKSTAARRASDHLPVVARVALPQSTWER